MRVVVDIEANGLEAPTEVWLIVCKDIDTGQLYVFRNPTSNHFERERFYEFTKEVTLWVGHHLLGYDLPVIRALLPDGHYGPVPDNCLDTLILSKLVDYSRKGGHSVEQYGEEFGTEKGQFYKFTDKELYNASSILFKQLETYCIRDVDITLSILRKYHRVIDDPAWQPSIRLEHSFQLVVNDLHYTGFCFNTVRAQVLLERVKGELDDLDKQIAEAFPASLRLIKEVTPRLTQHGTLNKSDFRWHKDSDLSEFNGGPFCRCHWEQFNPASHKQLIEVLNNSGWVPIEKTQSHIDCERELSRLKYNSRRTPELDIRLQECEDKLQSLRKSGFKINENNLSTLPDRAPKPARLLAKRILLESRRRTLTEWLGLVTNSDGRIHGRFYGIGAWTHRMAHQQPNTANIPNEYDTAGKRKLLGKELRSLWQAPKKRLLVGVDAEGIQLRIFAHYIDDPEFTEALVKGKKDDKTDPHSLNQRILGPVCKSRAAAKRFVYALLLGGGLGKLAEILDTSRESAGESLDRLLERYTGFASLKRDVIPSDAKRGYFSGLDGRKVSVPGNSAGERKHLCMSGYLQNGEAVVMKRATLLWLPKVKEFDCSLVNFVHDEWQTECPNNVEIALKIASIQADSLRQVGEDLGLKCPLAGSYWNDDHKDYTIGTNWYQTH